MLSEGDLPHSKTPQFFGLENIGQQSLRVARISCVPFTKCFCEFCRNDLPPSIFLSQVTVITLLDGVRKIHRSSVVLAISKARGAHARNDTLCCMLHRPRCALSKLDCCEKRWRVNLDMVVSGQKRKEEMLKEWHELLANTPFLKALRSKRSVQLARECQIW